MNEEYYKNRCVELEKKLDRVIDSHIKLEDKIKELQQRIEKAIEYIEQLPFNDLTPLEVKVIYKILKGEEK